MLASRWSGPFGGVPPFDKIVPSQFVDCFRTAISDAEANVAAIANATDAPTFDNTIAAVETSQRVLSNLSALFHVHAGNLKVGPVKEAEYQVRPLLAEF